MDDWLEDLDHVQVASGVTLEASIIKPFTNGIQGSKLAICLHPWSWLGGQMDDPVLRSLIGPLLSKDYHVLRYNSRSVGQSTGHASFTGFTEAKDLEAVVKWALERITDVRSLVLLGYSHGSLIASLHPLLSPQIKTSHILLSYPLGPRAWLTLFNSASYTTALVDLVRNDDSNVLVVYGSRDEFTSQSKYKAWASGLLGNVEIVEVEGGSHFWRGNSGRELEAIIKGWLP
ncbi:Alpha/Beta hydrolase protein [Crassisporium funariophilum]|nr:Alpha/Beta hydrolase protein [Crassisporium funariophilum]